MATFYAGIALDGPQLGDPKVAPIFQKNFFHDFKKILGPDHKIQKFEKCDFEPIREHLRQESEKKKNMTKEEKEERKLENQQIMMNFGYALVDSHLERVSWTCRYTVQRASYFYVLSKKCRLEHIEWSHQDSSVEEAFTLKPGC